MRKRKRDFSTDCLIERSNTMDFTKGQSSNSASQASGEVNLSLVKQDRQVALQETSNSLGTVRDSIKLKIINSGEAKVLSDTLSISNPQSIVAFGKPVAEQMSKCADEILRKQDISTLSNTSTLLSTLAKIMDKVDIGEIKLSEKEPGLISKLFNNAQKRVEQMLSKYNNIGTEIEKVCIELRTYENQIEQSNKDLSLLYNSGVTSYQELIKYTIAGEIALEEISAYRASVEARMTTDPEASIELSNINQATQLLEQRVQDLRMAETVALQSLPIIKSMEFGNLNLARKINSSFIVTIPVFKNAIAQAVIAKRQSLQAQAMKALDDKTNEMLMKNAQNAADNMRMTAALAGSSAIKVETIEQSWQTIMDGIKDTKAIQEELSKQRIEDKAKIEEINQKFLKGVN